ncbi:7036_t:CDS:2 [Funneliformis geosporum]|uniref:36_t:CDS:1 n=1 Tax=Funneliformis geosporum TaxID=1117311 RepID=A0A9W4SE57_9GLOM|nr:7036_t:CDS:2 [Funneliformis geosporum]CAI2166059.1 36_t:CDS:2 [Funneliformis geosporum]
MMALVIEPYHHVKLSKIIEPPRLPASRRHRTIIAVLPYIRQKKNRLSRFDCVASLFASVECAVGQDMFRTLSRFPIAFPLIIPKLDEADKFNVMLPLYTGPVIKWETTPGTIVENHLFNYPFKLIVAVRIGTNSQGKSIILNQLMTSNSMFSSCSEPRAEYGIPHMIDGSVEFTWLTQETCIDVFENYYKKGANKEIVFLANLHGDALEFPNQIKYLRQFPTNFLVFLMPGYTQNQIKEFEELVGSRKVVYGYVNHQNVKDKKKYVIDTNLLMLDKTLKKVRMFKEALDTSMFDIYNTLILEKSLQMTEGIEIRESQDLINFVKDKKCRHIKLKVFQLQRKQQSEDGLRIWQNNNELQKLTQIYKIILKLPLVVKRRALAHLEREISRISMIEFAEARNQAVLKKNELRKSSLSNRGQKNEKKIREEIAKIWEEVDNMSLESEIVTKLPELYSELLIGGQTIELLDGDTGSISEAWFLAICGHICRRFPKLRIFVISILGLQSSGKSTLLNALFACRFAISAGRCTRGLFMRLLFLDKDLSEKLNIDVFILIDTEGLGAPEKMDDPESEKKDRILVTYAMGVSHLTILNVLGESMRDLTEILQIAIVTMACLEKAGMAPNIFMVQHISKRNVSRLSEPEKKFRAALKDALKIAKEKDIEMGISNIDCLQILDERIRKGPSEQYHEDVVNLYNSIIEDCKNSKNKIEFSEWHSLIQNYWNAVSHEDFAVQTIDRSFQKHEELIKQEIRSNLQNWSPNDIDTSDKKDKIQEKCLNLIEKELEEVPDCNNQSTTCEECKETHKKRIDLEEYLKNKNNETCEMETIQTIRKYISLNRKRISAGLDQVLKANFIRKGISSESLDIINKNLENILKYMPNRKFSDFERKQKVEQVWNSLRNHILLREDIISIAKEIDKEVVMVYVNSEVYSKYKTNTLPDLSNHKAYKNFIRVSQYLEPKDLEILQDKLDYLINIIFKERAAYYFYQGIIQEWDKENTSLGMLDQKKDEYLKMIDTQLQYEHRLISEDHIAGDYLLKVIHKKAMIARNRERIDEVLGISWLTNAETIRLKYFGELASQVNSHTSGKPRKKCEDTFNAEFKQVSQDIPKSDLKILRENIEKELTTKEILRNEPPQNPSDDKKLWEGLGVPNHVIGVKLYAWEIEIIIMILVR